MDQHQAQQWKRFRQRNSDIFAERGRFVTGADLAERGRMMAAREVANDPESRKRVEDAYGVAQCRLMYPEAYQAKSIIDRLKGLIGL